MGLFSLDKTNTRRAKSEKKIRYAVVGLGYIAQNAVLPAFKNATENSELVALVSDTNSKLKELGDLYSVDKLYQYSDLEKCLVLENIDVAYIAVPNALHHSFVLRCASVDVNVLCEKPLGVSAKECEEMIKATRAANVKLMTAYRLHFEEGNMEAVQAVVDGKIGKAQIFNSVFSFQVKKNNSRLQKEFNGGALFDIGIYCINAARYIFQSEPEAVLAHKIKGQDSRFNEVDGLCSAVMMFSDNRIGQFTCSFAAGSSSSYEVIGTEGRLRMEPAFEYSEPTAMEIVIGDEKPIKKTFKHMDQFAAELIYFSDCILKDEEIEPSGGEGLADIRVIEAINASAQTGQLVELSPFKRDMHAKKSQVIITGHPQSHPPLIDVAAPHQ